MCLICVDLQKERMTILDAKRAFREMVVDMDPDHAREVKDLIAAKETEAKEEEKDAD